MSVAYIKTENKFAKKILKIGPKTWRFYIGKTLHHITFFSGVNYTWSRPIRKTRNCWY